jgi:hypothetical protein
MRAGKEFWVGLAFLAYQLASLATFVKLTFLDDYPYNWWNWIIAIPVNVFLSEIWPIYWLILRPLFGH